jgi:protein tyrosine phosphatase
MNILKCFNIIQIVLMLRRHRSNMINTIENYRLLYEICSDYAEFMIKNGFKNSKPKILFETPTDSYV